MGPTAISDDTSSSESRRSPTVTWLGHATAVAAFGTPRVLFDPLGRARTRAAGAVDLICITHSHVDHLNRWSLKVANKSAHLVVPRGAGRIVRDLGFAKVTEMTAGDQLTAAGLNITAVGTRHDNGRWRKTERPECCGYVVQASAGGPALHHAGDVDFSDHRIFTEIGRNHTLAATLLPIGGMLPGWYYRWRQHALDRGVHIDPDAALRIFDQLGAGALVPVHWGTVNLRLGRPSEPKHRLLATAAQNGALARVRVLAHGEPLPL